MYNNDLQALINLSSPRLAKTVPFVILLCLTPDDFTHQWGASGWERVKKMQFSLDCHLHPMIIL